MIISNDIIVNKHIQIALDNQISFTYNDTAFTNLHKFYNFIITNNNDESLTFQNVIEDVIDRADLDYTSYQLKSNQTKNGTIKTIRFNRDIVDGGLVYDEITFID